MNGFSPSPNELGATGAAYSARRMERAELMGRHTHESDGGVRVHIFCREGKYIARGRIGKQFFGQTLGESDRDAEKELRHLLTELDRGSYLRPSESRRKLLGPKAIPKLTFRELCDLFLSEKRKLRGQKTAGTYLTRLAPALTFADGVAASKCWPLAAALDRDFAVELRTFLANYAVTPNGRAGAVQRNMSARQQRNVLECVRGMLAWAARPQIRKLPVDFINPFTVEIVGTKPKKDPLRPVLLPIGRRMQMLDSMDLWQLCHTGLLLILPMRPEEMCGMLIGDVDWQRRHLVFGTRFGGLDFTKGGTSFRVPFPEAAASLLSTCVAGRTHGPLLRGRRMFLGQRAISKNLRDLTPEEAFKHEMAEAAAGLVQTQQDAKKMFREMLRKMGGCTPNDLAKSVKKSLQASGGSKGIRPYDLRGAVTTDMMQSGMRDLELRYLTGHACTDILNEYASLDIDKAMANYFCAIEPLLSAISKRFDLLRNANTSAVLDVVDGKAEDRIAPAQRE